jgi:hypothetical protein
MESMFDPYRGLVIAGVRDGRLLGFAVTYAVDSAAYHDFVYISDEGLPHNLSLCFFHVLATLAARQGSIRELMHGLHVRDDWGLSEFKRRLGLVVTPLPAKVWLAPGLGPLLRRVWPDKLYRWGVPDCVPVHPSDPLPLISSAKHSTAVAVVSGAAGTSEGDGCHA